MAQYISFDGSATHDVSAVNQADFDVAGDLEIITYARLTNWSASSTIMSLRKSANVFYYGVSTDYLRLALDTGTGVEYKNSTVVHGITNDTGQWTRVTRDNTTGVVKFYKGGDDLDGGPSWVQLGSDVASTAAGLKASGTDPMVVGSAWYSSWLTGRVYVAKMYDGIGGTLITDFNATDFTVGDSDTDSASGSQSNSWVIRGANAVIAEDSPKGAGLMLLGVG